MSGGILWLYLQDQEQEVAEHEKKRIVADKLYCQGFDWNGQYFSGQSMDGL